MTIDAFIDTNVLLYAVSNNAKEIEKKWLVRGLLEKKNFGLSVQVLQEFYVNATGKLAQTLPEAETICHRLVVLERVVHCQLAFASEVGQQADADGEDVVGGHFRFLIYEF